MYLAISISIYNINLYMLYYVPLVIGKGTPMVKFINTCDYNLYSRDYVSCARGSPVFVLDLSARDSNLLTSHLISSYSDTIGITLVMPMVHLCLSSISMSWSLNSAHTSCRNMYSTSSSFTCIWETSFLASSLH